MKTKILEFLKSNQSKTFYWTTANGFIVLMVGMLTTIQPDVVDPKIVFAISGAIALLNGITKAINKKFL